MSNKESRGETLIYSCEPRQGKVQIRKAKGPLSSYWLYLI